MKLTNALTLTTVKAVLTRTAMAAVVAGAAFMATPTQANAQVGWGVRVGPIAIARRPVYIAPAPIYVAPPTYGYTYFDQRLNDERRFEAQRRFEEERREHAYDWDRRRDWDHRDGGYRRDYR